MSLLIRGALILTMGENDQPFSGDILIEKDRIAAVVPRWEGRADEVIDASGMVAMPGLINAHNHTPMTLMRAFCDDLRLMEWLEKKMLPVEERMNEEDIYWGAMLAMAEMIRSGTTAYADMYIHMNHVARAVIDSGMRASLARGLVFLEDDGGKRLEEALSLIEKWTGAGNGRITTMLGPHAPFTCPPEPLTEVIDLARKRGVPIHIHLAETKEEVVRIRERYGQTPTEYLYHLGLFEHNHVLLAHAVHLTRRDIGLLRGMRGGIAHNPVSNLKLGCGIAPVCDLLAQGLTVGLGTDGAGSAATLDMFAEIKAAAWLQKVDRSDPAVVPARQVLRMATVEGAKLLGIDDRVGTLEEGKQADLILIDLQKPHLQPLHAPYALIAYSAAGADVDTVIIDGRVVMRRRELMTIDEEELFRQVEKRASRLVDGI
ncbi:5-methylthioadenosine/S-adenosylhomocysteine deaminase [Planifilum fimeticola]|uniref:5-methylthioadenosine/S-adenosylhomocysteine deaminase n=1 Tax=Planifilum fimeticola TaxID=201975 RepID=A0A2T0LG61_9BACL|nr:amidohydrolase [Planifilum fimeticola]PRX41260.1 5-methylthioadenosine/S-adenosylhomocysteine deaminase [Planifilum fimeticola]